MLLISKTLKYKIEPEGETGYAPVLMPPLGPIGNFTIGPYIVSVKLLSNNLTTLCLNGTLSCADFMLVIMGDYRSRQKIYRPILRIYTSIAGPYPGGSRGSDDPPPYI